MARVKFIQGISENLNLKMVFYLLLIVLLIPVWQSKFFVTNDGPSHLYNAKVLGDFLFDRHTEFYSEYYLLNPELEPNWLTHFLYVLLLQLFPAFLVEKIVISAYIIGFALGLKKLLKTINPKAEWLVILGLPLIYQKVFLMGFYNCAFSYVFYFFAFSYWLEHKDQLNAKSVLLLALLLVIIYFTHPIGLALTFASMGLYFIADLLLEFKLEARKNALFKKGALSALICLPALLLVLAYLASVNTDTLELQMSTKVLYHQLIEANFLFNLSKIEKGIAIAVSLCFGLAFFYSLFVKIKEKIIGASDIYLVLFLLCVFVYFNVPEVVAGGGFLVQRLQFIIFLVLLLWMATVTFHKLAKNIILTLVSIASLTLIIVRIPVHYKLSEGVEEYISVAEHIEEESTVLMLSFSHGGCESDGSYISDNLWMFMHAGEYIGTEKTIVSLSNYEANTGYFPLSYINERNPFQFLGDIEGQPPKPDILGYPEQSKGGQIDYIVLWCYDEVYSEDGGVEQFLVDLSSSFKKTYTSRLERVLLYKRR